MQNASQETDERVEQASEEPGSTLQEGEERYRQIQKLAYELWEKRGSPAGTPHVDWHEAEQILGQSPKGRKAMKPESKGELEADG
jgi:hypothetical protein